MTSKEKSAEYFQKYKEKYKDNNKYRLNRLLQQARIRANKIKGDCTEDELEAVLDYMRNF